MPTIAEHRLAYIEARGKSFSESVEDLKRVWLQHPDEVEYLAENWDSFYTLLTPLPLTPFPRTHHYKGVLGQDPLDVMWFVKWFVSHEMYDDGEPVLLYVRRRKSAPLKWGRGNLGEPLVKPTLLRYGDAHVNGEECPEIKALLKNSRVGFTFDELKDAVSQIREEAQRRTFFGRKKSPAPEESNTQKMLKDIIGEFRGP